MACKHSIRIHLLNGDALVRDLFAGNDLQTGGKFRRPRSTVGFEKADDAVRTALFAAMQLLQGRICLANAWRDAQVDAVPPTRARPRLTADAVEHIFGRRSAVLSSHHPAPGSV